MPSILLERSCGSGGGGREKGSKKKKRRRKRKKEEERFLRYLAKGNADMPLPHFARVEKSEKAHGGAGASWCSPSAVI